MKMKKIQALSCASASSTAICSSVDQQHYSSMLKNSTRSFHRLNTYLAADNYSAPTSSSSKSIRGAPCSISQLPLTPRPSSYYTYTDKSRKFSSHLLNHHLLNTPTTTSTCGADGDVSDNTKEYKNHKYTRLIVGGDDENRRRNYKGRYVPTTASPPVFGSETTRDKSRSSGVERREFRSMLDEEKEKIRKHFTLIDLGGGGDSASRENTWRYEQGGHKHNKSSSCSGRRKDWDSNNRRSISSSSSTPSRKHQDQVVVLRVSLHCRGCENKLRKHLFKMQGITSYEIDMEAKKVTVIGNITPIEVLTSISKVKNAQFWPSHEQLPSTSTSSSSTSTSTSTSTLDYFN